MMAHDTRPDPDHRAKHWFLGEGESSPVMDAPCKARPLAAVMITVKFFVQVLVLSGVLMGNAWAVEVLALPDQAIQPRAMTGRDGALRLIYYRGAASGGDLFYRSQPDAPPLRINGEPQSAVSMGTIRGAQAVLGKADRVHVVWNGPRHPEKKDEKPPMFYSRLSDDGKSFEAQRPVSGNWILDGGGAVAADHAGHVYVFWHGGNGTGEGGRRIYMRSSNDDGKTFGEERAISPEGTGVCGCCAMQALATEDGGVFVLYRTASDGGKNRDIMLLASHDGGKSFTHRLLDPWPINACPMTSMSLASTPRGVVGSWETQGKIRVGFVEKGEPLALAAGGPQPSNHPTLAVAPDGRVLVAWSEGAGWQKTGGLAWQILDATLVPVSVTSRGKPGEVPVWSFPCAVAKGTDFEIWR